MGDQYDLNFLKKKGVEIVFVNKTWMKTGISDVYFLR